MEFIFPRANNEYGRHKINATCVGFFLKEIWSVLKFITFSKMELLFFILGPIDSENSRTAASFACHQRSCLGGRITT